MKQQMIFDMDDPDDQRLCRIHNMAQDMYLALWQIDEKLRKKVKHATEDANIKQYEEIQELFYEILEEYNIKLDL